MDNQDKKLQLYLAQKQTLDLFLQKGAITQAQYNKSFGDLTKKMGMEEVAKTLSTPKTPTENKTNQS